MTQRTFNKSNNSNEQQQKSDYSKYEDFSKFSLWLVDEDYPSRTMVATGIMHVVIDGVEHQLKMYLHRADSKKNDRSPDLYGYVKIKPSEEVKENKTFSKSAEVKIKKLHNYTELPVSEGEKENPWDS